VEADYEDEMIDSLSSAEYLDYYLSKWR